MDIIAILLQHINVSASLAGAAVTLAVMYLLPGLKEARWFEIKPGTWYARLVPAIAPAVAILVCVVMEWDGTFSARDVVRGILSGWGSDFILRIYFKTVVGV